MLNQVQHDGLENMLNIGFSELVLFAVVALIFIGPKELPVVLRQIMKFIRELQSLGEDVKKQMHEVIRESGLEGTTTIIDMEGRKQQAYDIRELEKLAAPKKAEADE